MPMCRFFFQPRGMSSLRYVKLSERDRQHRCGIYIMRVSGGLTVCWYLEGTFC
jgi:hypothetical protein